MSTPEAAADGLRDRIAEVPAWYHTFEFPGGVVTDGYYDHRSVLPRLPIPQSLAGKRCLDLASADGLFAFEMARRGGEVCSVDLDDTTEQDWQGSEGERWGGGTGRARAAFDFARETLDLPVERVNMNVYDVGPEALGEFDFVFMGNILLHLSDPARALRAARSVAIGPFLSLEPVSLTLTFLRPRTPCGQLGVEDDPRWWTTNVAGHRRLLEASGFEVEDSGFPVFQRFGKLLKRQPFRPQLPWRCSSHYGQHLAFWLFNRPFGVPSTWALCR